MESLEICSYLRPERVLYLKTADKEQAIELLLDLICRDEKIIDPQKIRHAIWEREKSMSTGIGEGIAIPHARSKAATDFVVAFALVKEGLDFEALDGKPVNVIFMIVANDTQDKKYVRLLSRLMLRMKNTELITNLLSCKDSSELYKVLVESK
jgi:fructose-specific phosphotransferase system IIA component